MNTRPREQPPARHADNARPPLIIPATARTTTGTRDSLPLVTMTTGEKSEPARRIPHMVIIPATARTTTGTRNSLPLVTMTTGETSETARRIPHTTMRTWQVMGQEKTSVLTTQIDHITDALRITGSIRMLVTTLMLTRLLYYCLTSVYPNPSLWLLISVYYHCMLYIISHLSLQLCM